MEVLTFKRTNTRSSPSLKGKRGEGGWVGVKRLISHVMHRIPSKTLASMPSAAAAEVFTNLEQHNVIVPCEIIHRCVKS